MSALDRVAYRFFWSLLWLACKAWFRFRVVGKQNLPAEEAYILAPVHRSYLDTPVGGMVTTRRQRFLGKESLWRNRAAGRFLTIVGGFPVERGTADRAMNPTPQTQFARNKQWRRHAHPNIARRWQASLARGKSRGM